MSKTDMQIEAGGLLPIKTKVDQGATEQIVARTYHHPALGDRPVIRLASDRLGQAEDLAMEFLGFASPKVTKPIAVQQRRSLGFAAWALINDPNNAHYALDLVKRMKAAARKAKSKPGHAWDAYTALGDELGRSARHFLPPYWEEVGRTYKDLGNQTYAGRGLSKSLVAERVHALESDRERRRDVVLEFVLSGCLAGKALSDYANDLSNQYSADEAFAIFRDLCVRRTRGGMAPWAAMPKDFIKMAKAAELDGNEELEKWLEEVIETPAMGRVALQFWKTCSKHCKRIVARNPDFAVAMLRHTRPEEVYYYSENKIWAKLDLLETWGVLEFLWKDGHQGAPPLDEPIAAWFGRVIRCETPVPTRVLTMLEKLVPRLKKEKTPLPLSKKRRYGSNPIDIDLLETCLVLGIPVDDPPKNASLTFDGWLTEEIDHPYRNQDIVESQKDGRFKHVTLKAVGKALGCLGGESGILQRAFPLAAGDRPGIKQLWHEYTSQVIGQLEGSGLTSFDEAKTLLASTLWPDTLRLFDDLSDRIRAIEPAEMLMRTLQAGVFDEYGLPALEEAVKKCQLEIEVDEYGDSNNLFLTFPGIVLVDKVHAYVVQSDGKIKKHELRLPKKCNLSTITIIGDDLAVSYRDTNWDSYLYWTSNPSKKFPIESVYGSHNGMTTLLDDGSVFLGVQSVQPGDKQLPKSEAYFHDGERFWQSTYDYHSDLDDFQSNVIEVDPKTGKTIRQSVPPWFEEAEGGKIVFGLSELIPMPAGAENSPLGTQDGMIGWKTIERRDGTYFGIGIDGRRWDKLFLDSGDPDDPDEPHDSDDSSIPIAMLQQPGTQDSLPVTTCGSEGIGAYWLWDPTGSTKIAKLEDFSKNSAAGQVTTMPIRYWHFLKPRHEPSSKKLRSISKKQCVTLLKAATDDREMQKEKRSKKKDGSPENPLTNLLPAVKKFLPKAPDRMVLGVARVIEQAELQSDAFTTLREKSLAESLKETDRSSLVVNREIDSAAAHWRMETCGYNEDLSLSSHLTEVAAFLKGESKGGDLPQTNRVWFSMLDNLPLCAWQTFWRVTSAKMTSKDDREVPWLEFLEFWHELGLAELPGQFATMEGVPKGTKKTSYGSYDIDVDAGVSYTLQNGDDLFIVIEDEDNNQMPYQFLRYSTAKRPGNPPDFQVKNVCKLKKDYDPKQTAAFFEAARSCDQLPLPSKEELQEVATNLSASPTEIGLIWVAGTMADYYGNVSLPADLRKTLGWKVADVKAGVQSLKNLKDSVVAHLYASVVAEGMSAPFAEDRDPVLRSIEKTWRAKMPKRFPLDAALQKRLAAIGDTSWWNSQEELMAVAANPTKHPLLQPREIEFRLGKADNWDPLGLYAKKKNEPVMDFEALLSIVQLIAMVHGETPAGHEARIQTPTLIKQTSKVLAGPKMLLDLRRIHLYDSNKHPKPVEWISKFVGKPKASAKDGTTCFDDGLIVAAKYDARDQACVAFRPAKLKDQSDMTRLKGILAVEKGEDISGDAGGCAMLTAFVKGPGFQKLTQAVLTKGVPDGQWPQNPSYTATDVVDGIQKKFKLSDEGAILYAQILTLPNPTTANLKVWNDWTPARLKKASAELIQKKLVLEAKRARAGRPIFLPGEWTEFKAPWLPIETWKLPHLVDTDIDFGDLCPVGGPMVLRPFDELFAAAWQRVLDGDEPRYEAVTRKRKKR